MKAIKANRVYTITDVDVERFRKEGYDIYNDSGEIVKYGAGKTVSYEKYLELLNDYEALMEENAEMRSEIDKLKNDGLQVMMEDMDNPKNKKKGKK